MSNKESVRKKLEELGIIAEDLKALLSELDEAKPELSEEAKEVALEQKIKEKLRKLGGPCHIKGYQYVVDAIKMVVENVCLLEAITKELYPAVAKKHDTTSYRVERAIRHYIEVIFDRGDLEVLEKVFGNTVSRMKGKPTNSEFIALLADDLRMALGDVK